MFQNAEVPVSQNIATIIGAACLRASAVFILFSAVACFTAFANFVIHFHVPSLRFSS